VAHGMSSQTERDAYVVPTPTQARETVVASMVALIVAFDLSRSPREEPEAPLEVRGCTLLLGARADQREASRPTTTERPAPPLVESLIGEKRSFTQRHLRLWTLLSQPGHHPAIVAGGLRLVIGTGDWAHASFRVCVDAGATTITARGG
jgi:hypothetical protein